MRSQDGSKTVKDSSANYGEPSSQISSVEFLIANSGCCETEKGVISGAELNDKAFNRNKMTELV